MHAAVIADGNLVLAESTLLSRDAAIEIEDQILPKRAHHHILARGEADPLFAGTTHKDETQALHASIGIAQLLAIERATVER